LDARQGDLEWLGIDGLEHARVEQLVDAPASHTQHARGLGHRDDLDDAVAIRRIAVDLASDRNRRAIAGNNTVVELRPAIRTRQNA
jgi:hypothetical protein